MSSSPIYKNLYFDIDSAYRRCHLSADTASECLTIYNNMLLMALQMTFRGVPCPSLWGVISDTIADTCNSLIHNPCWDHLLIFDQLSKTIKEPNPLPKSIDFVPAQELAVDIPTNDIGKVDMYIDDTIGFVLDLGDNVTIVQNAVPMVINAFARPLNDQKQLQSLNLISLKKFQAEGRMEEIKVVLGWDINTCTLLISLPADKHHKWTNQIKSMKF